MSLNLKQCKAKTIGQLLDESALGATLKVFEQFGADSPEFKAAEKDYQNRGANFFERMKAIGQMGVHHADE